VQGVRPPSGESAAVQWVLGKVSDDDGKELSKIVTDMSPAGLVMDALSQELKRAGYNVVMSASSGEPGGKALVLQEASVLLDETHSVMKDEARCTVKIAIKPIPQGVAVGVAGYEAQYSDTAVANREQLPSDTLQNALQLLMTRAVPDIVKTLEQK
jgi:hypothetical protein